MRCQKIKFQDDTFILINGAICTEEQFRNGYSGYAHLFKDGIIRRHGEVIGSEKDIEYLEEQEISMDVENWVNAFCNMIDGIGWPF